MSRISGREFERMVLGTSAEWEGHFPPFVEFGEALEFALLKQPEDWHPLRPPESMGAKLLTAVRSALNEALQAHCSGELRDRIVRNTGLYSAVDTPIDYWHGTDAIACCDLGHVAPTVTIDLKARPDDGMDIREDHVIITNVHFHQVASNGKLRLENIAGVIADQLLSKLEQFGVIPSAVLT